MHFGLCSCMAGCIEGVSAACQWRSTFEWLVQNHHDLLSISSAARRQFVLDMCVLKDAGPLFTCKGVAKVVGVQRWLHVWGQPSFGACVGRGVYRRGTSTAEGCPSCWHAAVVWCGSSLLLLKYRGRVLRGGTFFTAERPLRGSLHI